MTTRSKRALAAVALALTLCSTAGAAQRVDSYDEALSQAGDDGVIVYCYGPDWSKRSVRMLESFWKSPELEAAAGDAKLVAIPFYQGEDPTDKAKSIKGAYKGPSFGVCPTVALIDAQGNVYAELPGTDYLGDGKGELGVKNVGEKLAAHRKQLELIKQAGSASGPEKAKLLSDACDLGIKAPEGIVDEIAAADPEDTSGCVRRQQFDALQFMYKLLGTADGFLPKDYVCDLPAVTKACNAIANDKAYKNRDRQAALAFLIGASRRNFVSGAPLKNLINRAAKIDKTTDFGILMPALIDDWGNSRQKMTPEDRKRLKAQKEAAKQKIKDNKKAQKEKNSRNKKADRNTTIE